MEQIRASKDQRITSSCVFLDLKKAFDTIDHEILIRKLENIGLRGHVSALLRSYLSNRYQYTQVNGSNSKLGLIRTGIPQGSVLGPILFLLYINDLTNTVESLVTLFADDTNIFDRMEQDGSNVEKTLSIVNSWMKSNKLKCNLDKSKAVIFGETSQTAIFDKFDLMVQHCIKYLGVLIDDDLSFKSQVEKI